MPQSADEDIFLTIGCRRPRILPLKEDLFKEKDIDVSMLRLDEIHSVVSGNKIFKLIYFLKEAMESVHRTIITFGGAYSNHLAAAAFACEKLNLNCIGIVRGEQPKEFSHTLLFCRQHGMQLEFTSRSSYRKTGIEFQRNLITKHGEHVLIPEGGFSVKGKKGAELISNYIAGPGFTHVCLPVGTATTFAGIVDSVLKDTKIIGFGVLKNQDDIAERFARLKVPATGKYVFLGDYHYGGYAKKNRELICFMNDFYLKHSIALDFVYTAKMMSGIYDLAAKDYFDTGAKILCIHTGGLQGNDSLSKNVLNF